MSFVIAIVADIAIISAIVAAAAALRSKRKKDFPRSKDFTYYDIVLKCLVYIH